MPDERPSAVSRWSESMDLEQFRKAEASRRKHLLVAWGVVLLVAVGMIGFAMMGGKKPKVAAEKGEHEHEVNEKAKAMINNELPTDPEEIKKLLSNPTNPVVKISSGKGSMLIELYEDKVPNTVGNMVSLAESGFYNGVSFHRIIRGFMAQGGCPFSKRAANGRPGTGDPGYKFADEFHPSLKHDGRGVLSMANGGPGTNGSQFFICFSPRPDLDQKHSVFGKVIAGLITLGRLEAIGAVGDPGTPRETVRFNVEVVLKQDHPYTVKKL